MFPLNWSFEHSSETFYYYKAMGHVETYSVDSNEIRNKLNDDHEATKAAHTASVKLTWDFMERIKCLQMPYTQEKLLRLLPYLAAKIGVKKSSTKYELSYQITQEEIAQLIGATRESVSAHLEELEKRKALNRNNKRIVIDMEYVPEEYICGLWFKNI